MNDLADPLSALREARGRRTLGNAVRDLWELGLFRLLRLLPIDWASGIGRRLTLQEIRSNRPWVQRRARANLVRLQPSMSDADRERSVQAFLENLASFVGEVPTVGRQTANGRVVIIGEQHLRTVSPDGGLLLIGLHLGNWELLGEALQTLGVQASVFYEHAESEAQTRILREIRHRLGLKLLEPELSGVRQALRDLRAGRTVGIFGDEIRSGRIMAPLFGRVPHTEGNLGIAVRLARKARAPIVICYASRAPDRSFHVTFLPPVYLAAEPVDLLDDVAALNALIEPLILKHLEQWFFLDDLLD